MYATQIEALKPLIASKLIGNNTRQFTAILDIEGTTTALPFVTKVLFPYAESVLESFVHKLHAAATSASVADADLQLFTKALKEATAEVNGQSSVSKNTLLTANEFIAVLKERMAANSKVPFLKQIQGVIWRSGYENGELKGHVFEDAVTFMQTMKAGVVASKPIATRVEIYSSGSITAQKLLFGYSAAGDLTPLLAGYHDPTTVGLKTEAPSFANLAKAVGSARDAHTTAFFTDNMAEVEACVASEAIDLCVFVRRPLNNTVTEADEATLAALGIPSIVSFSQFISAMKSVLGVEDGEGGNEATVAATLEREVEQFKNTGELKIF